MIDYKVFLKPYEMHPSIKRELEKLLSDHNHRPAKARRGSSICSLLTQQRRAWNIAATLVDLHRLNFAIESLSNFREKHLLALIKFWTSRGDEYGTIDNKLSYLRALLKWQGRQNWIAPLTDYWTMVEAEGPAARKRIAQTDKSWTGAAIDILAMLAQIRLDDPVVAMQLEICWSFGLRKTEAFLLRPLVAFDEAGVAPH